MYEETEILPDGKGFPPKMAEVGANPLLLSVQILLPEAIDRRLQRWTSKTPGASWPAWGGHITMAPNFAPRRSVDDVRVAIKAVCRQEAPFAVRLAAPLAVADSTRPDYFAVFLTEDEAHPEGVSLPLQELRHKLLAALEPLREDVRPHLVEQPFLPHVTLALGLSESEARKLAKEMRAERLVAEFRVEALWLLLQNGGSGPRSERFALGPT